MALIKNHPKIKAARANATPVAWRSISVNAAGNLVSTYAEDLDNRIINGYLVTWGTVNDYGEKFIKGAFAKSINDRGPNSNSNYKICFLWMHDLRDPLAQFAELVEDDIGLRFRTKPLDDVPNADRCITQIRSGTLNQFSIGFNYVWDKIAYDDADDSLVMMECDFVEGSVVTAASDRNTFALRSAAPTEDEKIDLNDDIELFIKSVPRKQQAELRTLFTRHKSLLSYEPQQGTQPNALNEDKEPAAAGGIYTNILNYLKS